MDSAWDSLAQLETSPLLTQYRTKINVAVSFGVILIFGSGGPAKPSLRLVAGLAPLMTGWALLLYGCANYAKAKGHSEWFGLLAVFFLPGMLALVLLRDRYKDGRPWNMTRAGTETESGLPAKLPSLLASSDCARLLNNSTPQSKRSLE
jgi:hypothetical protein